MSATPKHMAPLIDMRLGFSDVMPIGHTFTSHEDGQFGGYQWKPTGVTPGGQVYGKVTGDPWITYNQRMRAAGADAYAVLPDQITAIQRQILKTLLWQGRSARTIGTLNTGPGIKKITYYNNEGLPIPRPTDTFEGGHSVKEQLTENTVQLHGFDYDIHLNRVELDANGSNAYLQLSQSPQQNNQNSIIQAATYWREFDIFQGSAGPGYAHDFGKQGICNFTGITDPGALGADADDNLTAAGDGPASAAKIWGALLSATKGGSGPFELHMTPLVARQFAKNINSTSGKSDLQLMREQITPDGSGMFSALVVNPFLIPSETETTGTGAMLGFYKADDVNYVAEPYPLTAYPVTSLGLGWSAKIAWMGGVVLERPTFYAYANALTTA